MVAIDETTLNSDIYGLAVMVFGVGIDEVLMQYGWTGYVYETTYYHTDALGSVYGRTDEDGFLFEGMEYDIYGAPVIERYDDPPQLRSPNRYLFTGREWHTGTELYYYRARYYSPVFGRFLQRDPALLSEWYFYASSAPIVFRDPLGKGIVVDVAPGRTKETIKKSKEEVKEMVKKKKKRKEERQRGHEYYMELVRAKEKPIWERLPEEEPKDPGVEVDWDLATHNPIYPSEEYPTGNAELAYGLLRHRLRKHQLIEKLNFYGHGTEPPEPYGDIHGSPLLDEKIAKDMREKYPWLPCLFDKNAEIWFWSCYAGRTGKLLKAVAENWLELRGGSVWGYSGELKAGYVTIWWGLIKLWPIIRPVKKPGWRWRVRSKVGKWQ